MDLDDLMWRTRPLWDRRNIITEDGVVHLVDEDTGESSSFFIWIWLELRVDLDDESRSDSGKQTSLSSKSVYIYPNNL